MCLYLVSKIVQALIFLTRYFLLEKQLEFDIIVTLLKNATRGSQPSHVKKLAGGK
jgi:hypothetical protein